VLSADGQLGPGQGRCATRRTHSLQCVSRPWALIALLQNRGRYSYYDRWHVHDHRRGRRLDPTGAYSVQLLSTAAQGRKKGSSSGPRTTNSQRHKISTPQPGVGRCIVAQAWLVPLERSFLADYYEFTLAAVDVIRPRWGGISGKRIPPSTWPLQVGRSSVGTSDHGTATISQGDHRFVAPSSGRCIMQCSVAAPAPTYDWWSRHKRKSTTHPTTRFAQTRKPILSKQTAGEQRVLGRVSGGGSSDSLKRWAAQESVVVTTGSQRFPTNSILHRRAVVTTTLRDFLCLEHAEIDPDDHGRRRCDRQSINWL